MKSLLSIAVVTIFYCESSFGQVFDSRGFYCTPPEQTTKESVTWAFWWEAGTPWEFEFSDRRRITELVASTAQQWADEFDFEVSEVSLDEGEVADVIVRWELVGASVRSPGNHNLFYRRSIAHASTYGDPEFPCPPMMIILSGFGEPDWDPESEKYNYERRLWSVKDDVNENAYDFETIMLHEWGHIFFGPGHHCFPRCAENSSDAMGGAVDEGVQIRRLTEKDLNWARQNQGGLISSPPR